MQIKVLTHFNVSGQHAAMVHSSPIILTVCQGKDCMAMTSIDLYFILYASFDDTDLIRPRLQGAGSLKL